MPYTKKREEDSLAGQMLGPYDRNHTILVVDDTSDRLELIAALLRRVGYRVLTAKDGLEGFEVAHKERPDLIISDVAMPRLDGIGLCRMIRNHSELGIVPVLLVSAFRKDTESITEGLQMGAFDYMEVPFDPRLFITKVERLVELSDTERAKQETEERYRELVESASDIIYTQDLAGNFTSLNKAGERITGYTEEEALGKNITDVVVPEQLERVQQRMAEKVAGGGLTTYELEITAKDGHRVSLEVNSRLILKNGMAVGIQGIARDVTDRKLAEEKLRESEARFRSLVQSSNDAIILTDKSTKIILWNQGAETIFGYTEEEALGQELTFLMPEKYRTSHLRGINRYLTTGESHIIGKTVEFEGLRKDGTIFPLEISLATWESGDEAFCSAIIRDITTRKRREGALKESERQLAEAQALAHLGSWEWDIGADKVIWSDEEFRTFGLEPQAFDATYEAYLERVHPGDRGHVAAFIEEALRAKNFQSFEHRIVRPDGEVRVIHCEGKIVLDADGNAVKMVGTTQDITERKQAEAERDAERRLLDALFDQLPVGVIFRDAQGYLTRTNQKVCDIFGIGCGELNGMTVDDLAARIKVTKPEGFALSGSEYPTTVALDTQEAIGPVQLLITTPAGESRRIVTRAAPVTDSKGERFGVVAVVSDVTEKYAFEEMLRQSQKMESIGTLAGGVAHDFNNLLTVILGNAQLAFRCVEPGTTLQQRLLEIEKASTRATQLTRQLLAFSRRQRLERKTINLNDMINEIMKMLRRVIGEDIEVRVHESVHLQPVFADPAQIEQVVMNLAVNARDAMPRGGQLIIETRDVTLGEEYCRDHPYSKPGRYVEVSVSDTGTGMDEETKRRIFEPFFTTKEAGKGTGLGLAMVFGIVKQHGGLIEVYSDVGRGTSFKIYLPVDEKAVKEKAQEVLPPLRGGTETILVAEDEEALRELVRNILEELGYTVLLAKDGAEAVKVYETNKRKISLLIFDIVMPRMGGREALERIRETDGDRPPAIFLTGYSPEIVQYESVKQNRFIEEMGATLMQKPYNVETLGRKVREVLDSSQGELKKSLRSRVD